MRIQWHTAEGGICAAKGKKSYSAVIPDVGRYYISPTTYDNGRHRGYAAHFANTSGKLGLPGLWYYVGSEGENLQFSPRVLPNLNEAKKRCRLHLKEHFGK